MKQKNSKFKYLFILKIALFLFLVQMQLSVAQEPLTLERSIEIAMKNSPDIKRFQFNMERSRQLLNAQKASLKSQFSLTLNAYMYSHRRQFYDFRNSMG